TVTCSRSSPRSATSRSSRGPRCCSTGRGRATCVTSARRGVATVLEGTVQRAGNRVRIEARLSDTHDDRQIWADRYDRELTDVFAIQSAVTEEIARALNARLSPEEKGRIERRPTKSSEAYEFYLRGREYE